MNSDENAKKNPVRIDDCSQAHQRYKMVEDNYTPQFVGYKTCLPSCYTQKKENKTEIITYISGAKKMITLTNHIACSDATGRTVNENRRPGK